ncbi:MAG: DoxX family protein [Pyrinomonadaceae bacterium]
MDLNLIIKNLPALFAALFTAILFIQSGLDKVLDRKGNLEFLTGHFSKTFVAGMVPMMFGTITLMEIVTGLLSAIAIVYFFATGSTLLIFISGALGAASLTALFFGQRIAKDYPGAAVLVPYFILMLIVMYLTRPA